MERLYRSQKNRVLGGVAGGLAEYFAVDVVLIRLLWVFSIFLGGGIPVYIIAWIIIPDEKRAFAGPGGQFTGERPGGSEENAPDDGGEAQPDTKWEGTDERIWQKEEGETRARRHRSAGLILVGLGVFFLAFQLFGPLLRFTWPLLLVVLGIYLLTRDRQEGVR